MIIVRQEYRFTSQSQAQYKGETQANFINNEKKDLKYLIDKYIAHEGCIPSRGCRWYCTSRWNLSWNHSHKANHNTKWISISSVGTAKHCNLTRRATEYILLRLFNSRRKRYRILWLNYTSLRFVTSMVHREGNDSLLHQVMSLHQGEGESSRFHSQGQEALETTNSR